MKIKFSRKDISYAFSKVPKHLLENLPSDYESQVMSLLFDIRLNYDLRVSVYADCASVVQSLMLRIIKPIEE